MVMAQRCPQDMGSFLFGQRAPKHQSRMILKYHSLKTCVFGRWKGFSRFEAIASLDAYQITKYQILQKLIFLLPNFWRIRERNFQIRNFLARCLGNMIRWFIWFSKLCSSGHQGLLFKWFHSEKKCLSGWIHY